MHRHKLLGLIATSLLLGACTSVRPPQPPTSTFDASSLPHIATLTCYDHRGEVGTIDMWGSKFKVFATVKAGKYTIGIVKEAGTRELLYLKEGEGWRRVSQEEVQQTFGENFPDTIKKCQEAFSSL